MDKRRAAANLLRVTKSLEAIDDDESESALSEADSDPQSSRTITRTPTSPKADRPEDDEDSDDDREMDEDELFDHAVALLDKKDAKFALFYVSQSLRLNPNRTDSWLVRAECNLELDRPADAALDCNRSLALDGKDATMYCRRARCMQRLRRLADAVEDAEYATYLGGCEDAKELLDEVKTQKRIVEALEAKNHYTALGVAQNAGDMDIKLAYKAACMKWHPDRWARAPDTERELAELCFKECNTAHQVLADGESRVKYDFYLHQRQFDPSLPHPMDAPHHYQYVQHAQNVAQQKQWAAAQAAGGRTPGSVPSSQCSSPLSYSSTPMSPQWAFAGYPFPMSPMSPNHGLRSPSHGLRHAFGGRF